MLVLEAMVSTIASGFKNSATLFWDK